MFSVTVTVCTSCPFFLAFAIFWCNIPGPAFLTSSLCLHPADLLLCSFAHYLTPYMFVCSLFWGVGCAFSQHAVPAYIPGCKQGGEEQWLLWTYLPGLRWLNSLLVSSIAGRTQLQGAAWQLSNHISIALACQKMHLSSWIPLERLGAFPAHTSYHCGSPCRNSVRVSRWPVVILRMGTCCLPVGLCPQWAPASTWPACQGGTHLNEYCWWEKESESALCPAGKSCSVLRCQSTGEAAVSSGEWAVGFDVRWREEQNICSFKVDNAIFRTRQGKTILAYFKTLFICHTVGNHISPFSWCKPSAILAIPEMMFWRYQVLINQTQLSLMLSALLLIVTVKNNTWAEVCVSGEVRMSFIQSSWFSPLWCHLQYKLT